MAPQNGNYSVTSPSVLNAADPTWTAQFTNMETVGSITVRMQWSDRAMAQWHPTASTNIYDCIDGTWRFAEHQYDYIGSGNTFERRDTGWIDLFGWGTSGYNNTKPYSIVFCPSNVTSLTGANANYDWGQFNTIYNPRTRNYDPFGTWRTLTHDEWWYLCSNRRLKGWWSFAAVTITVGNKTVNCMVVFPDSVKAKPAGVSSSPSIFPAFFVPLRRTFQAIVKDMKNPDLPACIRSTAVL